MDIEPDPTPDQRLTASAAAADLRHIAAVVKAAREAAGLTQRELASKVGVSAGMIGQIETSRTRPSVSTLLDIARVLGLSLDALFRPTEVEQRNDAAAEDRHLPPASGPLAANPVRPGVHDAPEPVRRPSHLSSVGHIEDHVVRSDAREKIILDGGVQWELLTPEVDHKVSFMVVTYPPGSASSVSRHLLRHDDNEYFYLLEGVLQVRLAFEETTIYPGDAMSFDSSRPHRFDNRAGIQAVGVWAVARKGPGE